MTDKFDLEACLADLDDPYSVFVVENKNVIKFPDKNQPDKKHVLVDDRGVKWFEFTCSYDDKSGNSFIFSIWAKSKEDAEERMAALKQTAKIDGQLFMEIDV